MPKCTAKASVFAKLGRREVEARFDGGDVSSDGGLLLLRQVERKLGHLMRRKHGGRRARVRGTERVDADFRFLAGAVNLARMAVLGVRHTGCGWTVTT